MTKNFINEYPVNLIDTIGPMIARILKDIEKNTKDIQELKELLKRVSK